MGERARRGVPTDRKQPRPWAAPLTSARIDEMLKANEHLAVFKNVDCVLVGDLVAMAEEIDKLRKAMTDATAHLAGAASAYRAHAKRHASQGKSTPDALFSTRAADFDKAVDRARAVIRAIPGAQS